jgi:hypothetical protein
MFVRCLCIFFCFCKGRDMSMELSVPLETFAAHVAYAQQHGVIPSPSRSPLPVSTELTITEEKLLLREFVASCRSASISFDDVARLVATILNVATPSSCRALNQTVGIARDVERYTWAQVVAIAQAAKAQARSTRLASPPETPAEEASVGSSLDGWSAAAEELFALLKDDEASPTITTAKALSMLMSMVTKQKRRAAAHCDVVRVLVPEIMTCEEFEKHIVTALRTILIREPHPNSAPVVSSTLGSKGLLSLSEILLDKGKDSSMVLSSIASLDEKQRRARRLRSWVVANPKSYFTIPPCVMRSTDLWHLQKLRLPRLRSFVIRMRRGALRTLRQKRWHVVVVRCVERAEELMTRHADKCDRCMWLNDRFSYLGMSRGGSSSSFRQAPSPPAPERMVPTIDIEVRKPFTPRTNPRPLTPRAPPSKPLQVNESLLVTRIFERAMGKQRNGR